MLAHQTVFLCGKYFKELKDTLNVGHSNETSNSKLQKEVQMLFIPIHFFERTGPLGARNVKNYALGISLKLP